MNEKQKEYLTTREAAKILDVAVSTIQLWVNNGLLNAWTTAGGHRRIAHSSVDEMLVQQQTVLEQSKLKKQLSVVVVEDDAQLLRLYEKQLLSWNVQTHVITAKDGYEGLINIGRILPDVIITDLMMPNMDGFQMVRALNELSLLKHSLIIVISGLTESEVELRGGLPAGVHLFTKPVNFDNIVTLLRQRASTIAA
ncbi:MAG: response regulator [Gammaproteobacteria bacterium]|nr:response regulator [Gammaproteobacteria bacterium]